MSLSIRLTDDETEALRLRAAHENRSMQEVARAAIREYVQRTTKRDLIDEVLEDEMPRYTETLRRLSE